MTVINSNVFTSDRYTRRLYHIPASIPAPEDVSVRKNLAAPLRLSVFDYGINGASEARVTLILTHGTSFNKHLWQLVIDYLLANHTIRTTVKRILAIDAANHGDSAILNQDRLPEKACWPDHSRDILHTIEFCGIKEPVIGIGHSFGGGAMCHAAMMIPDTFLATIFIEPILFQMKEQTVALAQKTLKRRSFWETKAAATAAFGKMFKDWDKRQLAVFIDHGIREDPMAGGWTLKTTKEQEAATYLAAPHPQILDLLERSRGRHHFVWGSQSTAISADNRRLVEQNLRPPSTSEVLTGVGHLIPMTHPQELGSILAVLVQDIVGGIGGKPQVKL